MSKLTQMLDLIHQWVQQQHESESYCQLIKPRPGLILEKIQTLMNGKPFHLPREIIELYQWGNGSDYFSLPYPDGDYSIQSLFSLGEALGIAEEWNNEFFQDISVLPLFSVEDVYYWTVVSQQQRDTAPIYANDEPVMIPDSPSHPSLTAMIESVFADLQRN